MYSFLGESEAKYFHYKYNKICKAFIQGVIISDMSVSRPTASMETPCGIRFNVGNEMDYQAVPANHAQELYVLISRYPDEISPNHNGPVRTYYRLLRETNNKFTVEFNTDPNTGHVKLKQSTNKVVTYIATKGQIFYAGEASDQFQWTTLQQQ